MNALEEIYYKNFKKEDLLKISNETMSDLSNDEFFQNRIHTINALLKQLHTKKKEFYSLNPNIKDENIYFLLLYHYFKSEAISSAAIEDVEVDPNLKSYSQTKEEAINASLIKKLSKAYEYFFEKRDSLELSTRTIKRTHKELFEGVDQGLLNKTNTPGAFKKINNKISIRNREPSIENQLGSIVCIIKNSDKIETIMENLIKETNTEIKKILKEEPKDDVEAHIVLIKKINIISKFLNFFLYYHPFIDGNGRIARLIFDYLVRKLQIYPEILPISRELNGNHNLKVAFNESFIKFHYCGNFSELTKVISQVIESSVRSKLKEYDFLIKRSLIIDMVKVKKEMKEAFKVINIYYNKISKSEMLKVYQEKELNLPTYFKKVFKKDKSKNYYLDQKNFNYVLKKFEEKVVNFDYYEFEKSQTLI